MHKLIRALVTKIPFLGRYRLVRASDIARLQEHNRLLTEAATERARKLQELQEHNRLLIEAATERARKLQEREAELTNAITVMSRRFFRLSEHNRWLTETMMDGAGDTEHALVSRAVIQRLQNIEEGIQNLMAGQNVLVTANETKP